MTIIATSPEVPLEFPSDNVNLMQVLIKPQNAEQEKILANCLKEYNKVRIVITRPLTAGETAGACSNLHNLHINALHVYDVHGNRINLTYGDASFSADNGWYNHLEVVGTRSSDPKDKDKFMEFIVPPEADIDYIELLNRDDGCNIRLLGSYVDIRKGGHVIRRWEIAPVIKEAGRVYAEAREISVHSIPQPLQTNLPISYNLESYSRDSLKRFCLQV